ncbi:uncharacterized protein LOC133483049 isoform X1 [Phyllopteryx taeniolatus]|uniref:uncharacterized protein LOC133483049 isoform X1 n=2 Tax=Phyllopteryx taeniolatus TaxID=161469 RepID=UPI002AD4C988|nr:uncharacterized protein LOC133483049 isoform X1 [Phyllopteryx taeniolatus]
MWETCFEVRVCRVPADMDGVLDGASVLCVFKLVCSLLCLPSLATSRSPVGFCSCCILIFTDFLLTVYLSFLGFFESWFIELTPLPGVIALRFLLFLSNTYGAVLMLIAPLVAVETLTRLLWSMRDVEEEEEDEEEEEKGGWRCYAIGYLCCLSVWVSVALSLRCRWKLEEARTAGCLVAGGSLMRCLPNVLSPLPSGMRPCWGAAFLYLILILLTCLLLLIRRTMAGHGHEEKGHTMPPLEWPHRRQWWGSDLMLASLAVIGVLVLPLYLGVNILLLRSVETLLETCMSFFLGSAPRGSTPATPV